MNDGCVKEFRLVNGEWDEVRQALQEGGVRVDGADGFEVYDFERGTVCLYPDRVRFGGKLPVTVNYCKSQLERMSGSKLEEIK